MLGLAAVGTLSLGRVSALTSILRLVFVFVVLESFSLNFEAIVVFVVVVVGLLRRLSALNSTLRLFEFLVCASHCRLHEGGDDDADVLRIYGHSALEVRGSYSQGGQVGSFPFHCLRTHWDFIDSTEF